MNIKIKQETDGRWIADVPELPGVLAYGKTPEEARQAAIDLAYRVIADRIQVGIDQCLRGEFSKNPPDLVEDAKLIEQLRD